MWSIQRCELPETALLQKYRQCGAFTDCYVTAIPRRVSHAEYVEAFYTTALFKVERAILARLASKPSIDAEARLLADGSLGSFAAWSVEARGIDQLLLADFRGRTRSWLMVLPERSGTGLERTNLYFGSAVVPVSGKSGTPGLGWIFRLLMGFHVLYSRALLAAARSRLARGRVAGPPA
jgi:hypothetical protein